MKETDTNDLSHLSNHRLWYIVTNSEYFCPEYAEQCRIEYASRIEHERMMIEMEQYHEQELNEYYYDQLIK